jgi:maleylacetate reductase
VTFPGTRQFEENSARSAAPGVRFRAASSARRGDFGTLCLGGSGDPWKTMIVMPQDEAPRSPETRSGTSAVEELATLLDRRGSRRVLIITGPTRRFVQRIEALVRPRELAVFDRARVHVPEDVVQAARELMRSFEPDTIVSVGGGAATGLGKALRLEYDLYFVAIPTTYSGSEMTSLYGVTAEATKRTGKSERVRPDVVIYDPAFTQGMPLGLAVQSLLNALAHPISVLSTGKIGREQAEHALGAVRLLFSALEDLLHDPESPASRLAALRGAALAGQVLDGGEPGQHHRLAHLLGGRLGLDHAGLHSVLLPHSLRAIERTEPGIYGELQQALGVMDVGGALLDRLALAGAPVSLGALGATREQIAALARGLPEDATRVLEDAFDAQAT